MPTARRPLPITTVFLPRVSYPSQSGQWKTLSSAGVVRVYHSTAILLKDARAVYQQAGVVPSTEMKRWLENAGA